MSGATLESTIRDAGRTAELITRTGGAAWLWYRPARGAFPASAAACLASELPGARDLSGAAPWRLACPAPVPAHVPFHMIGEWVRRAFEAVPLAA